LQVGILQSVYDRIGRKIEKLANQAVSRGLTLEGYGHGESLIFAQLRELNEAYSTLANLAFLEGVHPLTAYLELCRIVGQLSVFSPARRPPVIPRYNHDDLGGCFYRVRRYLDELLSIVPEPEYHERPFIGTGLRMQVALERAWLEPSAQMFIAVQTSLDADECVRLMKPGQLDMKVGSSDRVETIFRMGNAGLQFSHAPNPPQALPRAVGLTYFQINRDVQQQEWQLVERSLTLAVRLNEELVTGAIDGQRILSLKSGSVETNLQLTLFVLMAGSSGAAAVAGPRS
jgi:type VI secretion system protein ImpJ